MFTHHRNMGLAAVFFSAMFVFTNVLSADELDRFDQLLDRVEYSFWRALFAPDNSKTRENFRKTAGELVKCGQNIKRMQYANGNIRNYGDLATLSSQLSGLMVSHSAYRRKRLNITGMKRTGLEFFRKTIKHKNVPDSELSVEEYNNFLQDTVEKNLASLASKFRSNRELSYSQRTMLDKTAEDFYNYLLKLRLAILRIRKFDPLFKKEAKSVAR